MKNYKCKYCWIKNPVDSKIITNWFYRFCSKSHRQSHTRENVRKEKEKIKVRKDKKRDKKQNSISVLSKNADKLWSEVIRLIWSCEYCGKKEFLNAHHIFSRSNKGLRWSLINWICLCSGHHIFSNEFSAHKTPCEFTYWLELHKGKSLMEKLIKQKQKPFKLTTEYLIETIKEFEEIINNNKKLLK